MDGWSRPVADGHNCLLWGRLFRGEPWHRCRQSHRMVIKVLQGSTALTRAVPRRPVSPRAQLLAMLAPFPVMSVSARCCTWSFSRLRCWNDWSSALQPRSVLGTYRTRPLGMAPGINPFETSLLFVISKTILVLHDVSAIEYGFETE